MTIAELKAELIKFTASQVAEANNNAEEGSALIAKRGTTYGTGASDPSGVMAEINALSDADFAELYDACKEDSSCNVIPGGGRPINR